MQINKKPLCDMCDMCNSDSFYQVELVFNKTKLILCPNCSESVRINLEDFKRKVDGLD